MSQPNAARSDDAQPLSREVEEAEPTPGRPSRELLEQVVRRTLADQAGSELPSGLLDALHDIARRQRALSQPWEFVVMELVDRVLESWFPGKLPSADGRRKMAAEIADVLVHDPTAAARLQRFWEGICEVSP